MSKQDPIYTSPPSKVTTFRHIVIPICVILIVTLLPTSANAQNQAGLCKAGQVCMFRDRNYDAGIAAYAGNDTSYVGNTFDVCAGLCGLNDRTSSIDNDGMNCATRHYVRRFYEAWEGSWLILRGNAEPNMHIYAGGGDSLSSHKWIC